MVRVTLGSEPAEKPRGRATSNQGDAANRV